MSHSSPVFASCSEYQKELVGSAPAWSRSLVHCKDSSNCFAAAVLPEVQETLMRFDVVSL
jgi:hypothetical protein